MTHATQATPVATLRVAGKPDVLCHVTDTQAASWLWANGATAPGFVLDIAQKQINPRRRYPLSDKQLYWLHKFYNDLNGLTPAATVVREELTDNFQAIATMFDTAGSRLRYPKIRLSIGEQKVVLNRAGSNSRYPGAINGTDGAGFRGGKWFGRINIDGTFTPGRDITNEVRYLLGDFAANPTTVAANYGRRTGSCCFCGRTLEDARSVAAGYGPVCADNFGLAWGNRPAPAPQELVAAVYTPVAGEEDRDERGEL